MVEEIIVLVRKVMLDDYDEGCAGSMCVVLVMSLSQPSGAGGRGTSAEDQLHTRTVTGSSIRINREEWRDARDLRVR